MRQDGSSRWNVFLLAWCTAECFLFAFSISAWPTMITLYKKDGVYSDLCQSESEPSLTELSLRDNATHEEEKGRKSGEVRHLGTTNILACAEQDEAYNYVYTVGIVLSPVLSYCLARANHLRGIRTTRIITLILLVSGMASLAVTSKEFPSPLTIGMLALNVGGNGLYMTSNQVAYKFKARGATAAALITGSMYTGAGLLPEMIIIAHDHGISTRQSFELLGSLLVLVLVSTFAFFPKEFFTTEDSDNVKLPIELQFQKQIIVGDGRKPSSETSMALKDLQMKKRSTPLDSTRKSTLLQTIATPKFYLLLVWRVVHTFLFTLSRGVLNAWLYYVTNNDQSKVNHMTDVYATAGLFSIPLALLGGFLFDLVVQCLPDKIPHRGKVYVSSAICLGLSSLLGAAMCACAISEIMELIYVMMLLMTVQVVFLFCFTSAYLRRMYDEEKFGVLLMITALATSPFNFLQVPLFAWCASDPGNWKRLYWLLLLLTLSTLIHPVYMLKKARSSFWRHQLAMRNGDSQQL